MAEFVMKDLVAKAGREDEFYIESATTSTEEIKRRMLRTSPDPSQGGECLADSECASSSSPLGRSGEVFDFVITEVGSTIGMDQWNLRNMRRICGDDPEGKIHLLMDYTNRPGDVADP